MTDPPPDSESRSPAANTGPPPLPARSAGVGQQYVDEIRHDLLCPNCEYNLRGLRGDVVNCPECGFEADVARLVVQRWRKPWWRAPGLTRIQLSAAWFALGLPALLVYLTLSSTWAFGQGGLGVRVTLTVVGVLTWIVGWIALLFVAWSVFRSAKGPLLALLGHLILVGYLLGLFGGIGGLFGTIGAAVAGEWIGAIYGVIVVLVSFGLAFGARRLERFTAEQCIREHLRRSTMRD